MNRKELVRRVASVLRDNNIKKPVYTQKQVLHISDDDGNTKDFIIRKNDTDIAFTAEDIDSIIDACIYVIQDTLKKGENISVRGFGTLGLHYRKARATKHPATHEHIDIKAHFVPKFIAGNDLKMCAKMYELSTEDKLCELPPLRSDYDGEDGE